MDTASLPLVINTRPTERAAPLTCHLQAAGFTVIDMPMLALHSCEVSAADMALMRAWAAGDYQALIIVSPTAAASGLAVWQALKQSKLADDAQFLAIDSAAIASNKIPSHIIAVGSATAMVLKKTFVLDNDYQVLQPTLANNEGMLAMPEVDGLQAGDKLLVWRGHGGRRLLVDTLQARGIHIDSIAWYERKMPAQAKAQYSHWLEQFSGAKPLSIRPLSIKPVVIISSGSAFEHWQQVVEQRPALEINKLSAASIAPALADFSYIVLGERLATMVANQQLEYWRVEDLAPETILAVIQSNTKDAN